MINLLQISELFGVNYACLCRCVYLLPGFPPVLKAGVNKLYSRRAVNSWAKGKDVVALFRQAYRDHQTAERYGDDPALLRINRLRRDFLSGKYATPSQKAQHFARRMIARLRPPSREVTRVKSQWS